MKYTSRGESFREGTTLLELARLFPDEEAARHNFRELDTIEQMAAVVEGMAAKRLRYRDLVRDNGLPAGARSA